MIRRFAFTQPPTNSTIEFVLCGGLNPIGVANRGLTPHLQTQIQFYMLNLLIGGCVSSDSLKSMQIVAKARFASKLILNLSLRKKRKDVKKTIFTIIYLFSSFYELACNVKSM